MLQCLKKDMKRDHWQRALEKRYCSEAFKYKEFDGVISLLILHKVSKPLTVSYDSKDILIADNGFKWVQIAFKNANFWLTAMFDDKNKFIELYFDITKGNFFEQTDNPYFIDLFLDVVVTDKREIYMLDKDELDEAFGENVISQEDYDLAVKTANNLCDYLKENAGEIIGDLHIQLEILEAKMNKNT